MSSRSQIIEAHKAKLEEKWEDPKICEGCSDEPGEPAKDISWRPIAGTGAGNPARSKLQLRRDYDRGCWTKPAIPPQLATGACTASASKSIELSGDVDAQTKAVHALRLETPDLGIKKIVKAMQTAGWELGGKEVKASLAKIEEDLQKPKGCIADLDDDTMRTLLAFLPRSTHPTVACVNQHWRALVRNDAFVVARRARPEVMIIAVAGENDFKSKRGPPMDGHPRVSMLVDGTKWVQLAPLGAPTNMHCAVACEEEVYVFGGHHAYRTNMFINPEPCGCVMVWSPPKNEWRGTAMLNKVRCLPGVVAVEGKVYAIGGLDTSFKVGQWAGFHKDMRHCEMYDPKKARWSKIPHLPYACNSARCVAVRHKIYVMGGMVDHADDHVHFGVVQIYDTKKRTWRVLEQEMPIQGGVVFFDGVRILVLGGAKGNDPPAKIPTTPDPKREAAIRRREKRSMRFTNERHEAMGLNRDAPPNILGRSNLESSSDEEDDSDDDAAAADDDDTDDEEEVSQEHPITWDLAWPYGAPATGETWALDVNTETWQQLASAPKTHQGWYLYRDNDRVKPPADAVDLKLCGECGATNPTKKCVCRTVRYCDRACQKKHFRRFHQATCPALVRNCGDVIRAADDPSLNYVVATDTWVDDPSRPALKDHMNASEIVCVDLPF